MVVDIKNRTCCALASEGYMRFEPGQFISWVSAITAWCFARMRCVENREFEAVVVFGVAVFTGSCRFLVCPNSSAGSRFKATGGVTSHPPDRSYAPVALKRTWILFFQEYHFWAGFGADEPFPVSFNGGFTDD